MSATPDYEKLTCGRITGQINDRVKFGVVLAPTFRFRRHPVLTVSLITVARYALNMLSRQRLGYLQRASIRPDGS